MFYLCSLDWSCKEMDTLAQMLTDHLEPKEEHGGQITEECMLGNSRVNLPEDLLEDVSCLSL